MMDLNQQNSDATDENADTHITINPPAAAPAPTGQFRPVLPVLSSPPPAPPTPPAPTPSAPASAAPAQRIGSQQVITEPGRVVTKKETKINWGSIVKGAVIVTAVVLAGVGGYLALHAIAGAIFGNAAIGAAVTPVVHGLTYAAHAVGTFLPSVIPGITGFFTHAFGIAAPTLASHAVAAHAAGVASTAMGFAGAGVGLGVAAPRAIDAFNHTNFVSHQTSTIVEPGHTHTITTSTTDHPALAQNNGNVAAQEANLASTKGLLSGNHFADSISHFFDGGSSHASLASNSESMHSAAESSHSAADLGHFGDHLNHDHSASYTPDIPDSAASRAHRKPSGSWANRFAGNTMRPSIEGGYAASLQQKSPATIAPRAAEFTQVANKPSDSFAQDLNQQRAELDAALAEPSR